MCMRRWPENPAPACGGTEVHGRRLLVADTSLTLELARVVAYDAGLAVHLTLTVAAGSAHRAQYQTRPLTDPRDTSARWSYLDIWLGTTGHLIVADPYCARPDIQASAAGMCTYRTEPQYWIGTDTDDSPVRSLTLTAEWRQIGLNPTIATLALDHVADRRTRRAHR
ncbi:serine/threonine protein kinase [Rhodococcus sp. NPDC059968]|uniref:serine/threonine protein kinase n=1 Tax=Rhodococcus sp. NPDC059968 TaxID=3347017 RepID=UPI00366DD327